MLYSIMLASLGKEQIMQVLFIAAIIVVFYFFSIRPQRKKYTSHKVFLNTLKPGVQVVTIGGIHGSIITMDDNTVTIEINSKGTIMVLEKNAISVEASQKYSNNNTTQKN